MGISVRNHRDNTSRSFVVTAINKMGGACTSHRILWLPRSRPLVGILHVISFLLRTETFPPSLSLSLPPPGSAPGAAPEHYRRPSARPPARGHLQLYSQLRAFTGRGDDMLEDYVSTGRKGRHILLSHPTGIM